MSAIYIFDFLTLLFLRRLLASNDTARALQSLYDGAKKFFSYKQVSFLIFLKFLHQILLIYLKIYYLLYR